MTLPTVARPQVPRVADERTMLAAWLDFHRATLLMKCSGLDEPELKRRAAEPSTLSLLGLVRHMTEVERSWFVRRIAGESHATAGPIYYTAERRDDDFDDLDSTEVSVVFDRYAEEIERCRRIFASADLNAVIGDYSVRWIATHMLEEYARHNGHADLLRERIDGARGT